MCLNKGLRLWVACQGGKAGLNNTWEGQLEEDCMKVVWVEEMCFADHDATGCESFVSE